MWGDILFFILDFWLMTDDGVVIFLRWIFPGDWECERLKVKVHYWTGIYVKFKLFAFALKSLSNMLMSGYVLIFEEYSIRWWW